MFHLQAVQDPPRPLQHMVQTFPPHVVAFQIWPRIVHACSEGTIAVQRRTDIAMLFNHRSQTVVTLGDQCDEKPNGSNSESKKYVRPSSGARSTAATSAHVPNVPTKCCHLSSLASNCPRVFRGHNHSSTKDPHRNVVQSSQSNSRYPRRPVR